MSAPTLPDVDRHISQAREAVEKATGASVDKQASFSALAQAHAAIAAVMIERMKV